LAEAVIGGDPLISNLLHTDKANVMLRELARLLRPARLLPALGIWIDELLDNPNREFYHPIGDFPDGQGAGLIEAARGALGHWVHIENQKITHYQIITPTTWNGSPRDHRQQRGAWEEALVGTPIRDSSNPFEAGLVIRSFDPCLVCAVHTWRPGGKKCAHFHLGL
jgi:hydrogenase large subunit